MSKNLSRRLKTALMVIYDYLALFLSAILAILLVDMDLAEAKAYISVLCVDVVVMTSMFILLNFYSSIWKYATLSDAVKLTFTVGMVTVSNFIVCIFYRISIRWIIAFAFILFAFVAASRFGYRIYKHYFRKISHNLSTTPKKRVMIIGAGRAATVLLKEMETISKYQYTPVCLIDDDDLKLGKFICGIKVVGNTNDVKRFVKEFKIEEIIICMPKVAKKQVSKIYDVCKETGCQIKIMPGMYQLVNGQVTVSKIRDVEISDLLGRDQVNINLSEVDDYIKGNTVLITGGGGSIGSELSRQVANHKPKHLIIVDIYENNAYDIEQELRRTHKDLNLTTLIASVRDEKKILEIFGKFKPDIVFHAAAHKHVPLMETSPDESVKNNVFGTLNVVNAADKTGVKKFVMISTDKAVNPTNVMGATKRICEMIIQAKNRHSKTDFVAVRFGNVLGSNGSVIPLFKRQIEEGGPVTVTDKNIIRFFMTIPEAVSLVMQAGAYAKGGEIFVLDMGEPVKIYDLAVSLIKLSGLEPDVDIEIKEIGLRPGEKLYEETLMEEEGLKSTENELIHIGQPIDFDEEKFFTLIKELKTAVTTGEDVKGTVKKIVPTYKPQEK